MLLISLAVVAAAAFGQDPFAGLSDPTRAYGGADESAAAGPVLQSTFVGSNGRRAQISGRVVRVGDKVGAATVSEIHTHEVVLRDGTKETRLRLNPKLSKGSK
jgi:hypothetical protein